MAKSKKSKGPQLNHTGYVGKVLVMANGDRYVIENDILEVNGQDSYMMRPTTRPCLFSWEAFQNRPRTDGLIQHKVWKIEDMTEAERALPINEKYKV